MIESASASISNVNNNKNLIFSPFLIGIVALTDFSYLLSENCSSPILDLNLLRVAARMAAWAAALEDSSCVNKGIRCRLYAVAIKWPRTSAIAADLIKQCLLTISMQKFWKYSSVVSILLSLFTSLTNNINTLAKVKCLTTTIGRTLVARKAVAISIVVFYYLHRSHVKHIFAKHTILKLGNKIN